MSILGSLVDITRHTRAGDGMNGATFQALAHSLPATSAELAIPVIRSIEAISRQGSIDIFWLGGNHSQNTVGVVQFVSAASVPTIAYDLCSIVFHSSIR